MNGLILSFQKRSTREEKKYICHLTTIGQNQVVWHWLHHIVQTNCSKWAVKSLFFLSLSSLSVFIFFNLDTNHFSKFVWHFPSFLFVYRYHFILFHFGGINAITHILNNKECYIFNGKTIWFDDSIVTVCSSRISYTHTHKHPTVSKYLSNRRHCLVKCSRLSSFDHWLIFRARTLHSYFLLPF